MAKRRATPSEPARDTAHLVRSSAWAGVREGDPVDVDDPRERRGEWTFLAHVRNELSGVSWVEVVGGSKGERRVRSFREDQLYPHRTPRSGRTAAASLADAPSLPF